MKKRRTTEWRGLFMTTMAILALCCKQQAPNAQVPKPDKTSKAPSPSDTGTAKPRKSKAEPVRPVMGLTDPIEVAQAPKGKTERRACGDADYRDPYTPGYTSDASVLKKVEQVVSSLSVAELAAQIRGTPPGAQEAKNWEDIFRSPDNTVKGIKGFKFRDGPRGVNLDAECQKGNACFSTVFPAEIARGAAFDADLEYRIGQAIGDETLASGQTMMLAPSINILRHPAWGRAQESYGEDAYLLGRLGSAFVAGVQRYIPACSKHYVANNVENNRRKSRAVLDEQTLREIYGTAYEMTIKDGGVACVMASYNLVNGINAAENRHVLTDILRDDYDFRGFVISDWWALDHEFDINLTEEKYETTALKSITAGLDMEMPWALNYGRLEKLVADKKLDEKILRQAAARVLEQKFRFRIANIDGPVGLQTPKTRLDKTGSIVGNEAHLDLAYEAAVKSAVLLKNENQTLPIDTSKVKRVAVIGAKVPYEQHKWASKPSGTIDFARDINIGDLGSSRVNADPNKSIGPYAGVKSAAPKGVEVVAGNSVAAAKDADFVIVVAGLTPGDEGEEYTGAGDRTSFALDAKIKGDRQNKLIRQVAALGKPMAVALVGGSVIDMPWLDKVPSVIMSWYAGIHGGRALGDLVFGKQNFSGKLPLTWPTDWNQMPVFDPGIESDVNMDYYLGYRYFDQKNLMPLFPFGHGLSYSKFELSNLEVPCRTISKQGVAEVKVNVTNRSETPGEQVIFLFASYPETQARRSMKELKGFARVSVAPGKTKQVTLPLRISSLKYWNSDKGDWEIESGLVELRVGGSSGELPLVERIVVQ